jgi:hypothetical protein
MYSVPGRLVASGPEQEGLPSSRVWGLLADTGAAGNLELEEDLEDELEEEAKGRIKNSFSDNLASLVGMGFMQEEAEFVRRAAFNHPGLAVDYLVSGVPAAALPPDTDNPLAFLRDLPEFQHIRKVQCAMCNVQLGQCELVQCAMCRLCGRISPPSSPPGRHHRLAGVPAAAVAAVRADGLRRPPHHARQGDGRPTHARPVAAANV